MPRVPQDNNAVPVIYFPFEIVRGTLGLGYSRVSKFGHNDAVGFSNYELIAPNGIYRMPTAATALQLRSTSAADTAAGAGARKAVVMGIGPDWTEVSETVTLNGVTPVLLGTLFRRVFRMYVLDSGTYSIDTTGSHGGTIILESQAGAVEWGRIDNTDFAHGQTQYGAYTVPIGYTAYIPYAEITVEANKSAAVALTVREGANKLTAPYTAFRLKAELRGITGGETMSPRGMLGAYSECSDIVFKAIGDGANVQVSVNFEIWLVKNDEMIKK